MEVKAVVSLSYFFVTYWIHLFFYYPFNQNYPSQERFKRYQGKEQNIENEKD